MSSQAPVTPNASPERAVAQVPAVEELPDGHMVDVEQALEVFARETGGEDQGTPRNPIEGGEAAAQVAASLREQFGSNASEALRAQASRTPADAAALLRSP